MRIASLLASATEMVYALGLGDRLVAISHECDHPADALDKPRVSRPRFDPSGLDSGAIDTAVREAMARHGSVYQLDVTTLEQAQPDLILCQAVCEVCAVPTSLAEEAARVLGGRVRVVSLDCHTIEDIFSGITAVGEASGASERAAAVVAELRARVQAVAVRVTGASQPTVLALEWLDPPFVPGHWTPEMVAVAGGELLVGDAGVPSRQWTWKGLGGLDPDVLLLMPCGFGVDQARRAADRHVTQLAELAPRAVQEGRAYVVDGSAYFNRSGPRTVDGIEILATLLHPDRFEGPGVNGKADIWWPRRSP